MQNNKHLNNSDADNKENHAKAGNGQERLSRGTTEASKRAPIILATKERQDKIITTQLGGDL